MDTKGKSLPRVMPPTATWRGIMVGCSHQARLVERSAHKRSEQRVRLKRFRLQFGMELHADEPGMVGEFDNFRQHAVRRHARKSQPDRFQALLVPDIYFVAMAMALADLRTSVDLRHS